MPESENLEYLNEDPYVSSIISSYKDKVKETKETKDGHYEITFESGDCQFSFDSENRTLFLVAISAIEKRLENKELAKRSLIRKLEEGVSLYEALGHVLMDDTMAEMLMESCKALSEGKED